jgi:phospholipase/carboxylesterase
MDNSYEELSSRFRDGRLRTCAARPSITADLGAGTHTLTFPGGRNAQLHIPAGYDKRRPAPLLALFHGATGLDGGATAHAIACAERHGAFLIVPKSLAPTWDIVHGSYGADLAFFNFLLDWIMNRYAISRARIGIAGFSDGASYALSVGLMNGDLFHDILAFSPGFVRPLSRAGQPRVYVAHGKDDTILPVDCGRRIAQRFANEGLHTQYHEFAGGHLVPQPIVEEAMQRFVS